MDGRSELAFADPHRCADGWRRCAAGGGCGAGTNFVDAARYRSGECEDVGFARERTEAILQRIIHVGLDRHFVAIDGLALVAQLDRLDRGGDIRQRQTDALAEVGLLAAETIVHVADVQFEDVEDHRIADAAFDAGQFDLVGTGQELHSQRSVVRAAFADLELDDVLEAVLRQPRC